MTSTVLEVVVTVLNEHHPRATQTHRDVVVAARALTGVERAAWLPVLQAYEAFSRELLHHMHEEEELMLDRVQLFAARSLLRPGALATSRDTFEELFGEHARQHRLAKAVRDALAVQPMTTHADEVLAVAVKTSLEAFEAHVAFEDTTLRDALVPYLNPLEET